jgi:hypothetical protein
LGDWACLASAGPRQDDHWAKVQWAVKGRTRKKKREEKIGPNRDLVKDFEIWKTFSIF